MSDIIYERLRAHLDELPGRFPSTESGIEIAILKKIFEPEEAEMALQLRHEPETLQTFYRRTGIDPKKAGHLLERMARKGQIFRMSREGKIYYNTALFIPGIRAYQINNLDQELSELVNQYLEEALGEALTDSEVPIFRVLPIDENLSMEMKVMPYDRVKALVRSQRTIALAECVCRKEKRLTGHDCNHIDDVCLLFSYVARYYMDNGLARLISVDEAIDVLNRSEMDGLVHSPQNAQRPMGICNCCGCCCSVLRGITQLKLPPSKVVRSDYYCVCDPDACSGCGECTDRCQVEAIVLDGEVANINYNRCIGCGLCVSACPTDALKLVQKKTENLSKIPASVGEIFMMHVAEKAQYTGKS